MSYHLLTGATGLLGNYLVRDLMLAGVPMAVLVRPSRRQTARQRVEVAMCEWESSLGRTLPRPVVLEGDISQPDLGLDGVSLRWAAEYCDTVIHNAASLQFHATSSEGEPWRSNVNGVMNVLEFCRNTRIRRLHHVSTAYIAGLREGKVLETEVNVGQKLSNDYEVSKLQAEEMVRAADCLDSLTVFRPGIIIGDSETGLTTTYHGFYAALQLAHTIVRTLPSNETGLVGSGPVRLALSGSETKHLVPVEWVSAVMAHVITKPGFHGETYHLTPNTPVTTRLIRDVLEESIGFYGTRFVGTGKRPDDLTEVESVFYDHIQVYNSYWRQDPGFDTSNTRRVAPHLLCPHVDRSMLVKLSRIAIEAGFPTPSKKPYDPEFDAQQHLQPLLDLGAQLNLTHQEQRLLGLDVTGHGGGQWQLIFRDGDVIGAEIGIHDGRSATCQLNIDTFAAVAQGKTSMEDALQAGDARIIGNGLSHGEYANLLDRLLQQPVIQ